MLISSSRRRSIAVRGKSRARRVQTVNCWRVDVFVNRPDSTSSPHFGIESLAENAEIAEAGQKGWHEIVLDASLRGTWCCARHLFGSSPRSPRSPREIFRSAFMSDLVERRA